MMDKVGGIIMILLGGLLAIYTVIDSLDGSFRHVSKMRGLYQTVLENGAFDFYFSLIVQVCIGMIVMVLGALIYWKPEYGGRS